jgi:hypothetical protein
MSADGFMIIAQWRHAVQCRTLRADSLRLCLRCETALQRGLVRKPRSRSFSIRSVQRSLSGTGTRTLSEKYASEYRSRYSRAGKGPARRHPVASQGSRASLIAVPAISTNRSLALLPSSFAASSVLLSIVVHHTSIGMGLAVSQACRSGVLARRWSHSPFH